MSDFPSLSLEIRGLGNRADKASWVFRAVIFWRASTAFSRGLAHELARALLPASRDQALAYNPMKKLISTLLAAASLASVSLLISSGCAGTATRESTGEYVDDSAITTKVKAELVRDPIVKALQVEVKTFKGVVQLSGFVDTKDQKSQAEADAKTVAGVQDVKNDLVVKTQ